MKKVVMFFVLFFLFFLGGFVNAKVVVINTNSYEPAKEDLIEKNVTRTLVFYKTKRIRNFAYDQIWYDYETDKLFDERMEEKLDDLNYEDKTAHTSIIYPIARSDYLRYYECYDEDFDYYYKDYDIWNPCLS